MQRIKLLFLGWVLSISLSAQPSGKEETAVHKTVESMFSALTNADTIALKNYVTTNVRFYEYGRVWNMDTLIQKAMQTKTIKDFKRTNSFLYVSTSIQKKTSWVTYYLQSIISRDAKQETINWQETVVLVKERGHWKVDVLHSARINKN